MISQSERALCEIERRMKRIRTDDGYHTNAGLNVFRARRKLDTLPAIVVWDSGEDPQGNNPTGAFDVSLNVSIEVHATVNQDDTGIVLEKLKADVKRAMYGDGNGHGPR
jgi:hypothetical protein